MRVVDIMNEKAKANITNMLCVSGVPTERSRIVLDMLCTVCYLT